MTEAEWLACDNSWSMYPFVRQRGSTRKRRLFAVACARRVWHLIPDKYARNEIGLAERDGGDRDGFEEDEVMDVILGAVAAAALGVGGSDHRDAYIGIAGFAACAVLDEHRLR